ncbi:hypothetical protein GWK47_014664 [Chionoecetes opilio]|uniref:MAM domain-containing protein n=1 Tax=Chionoecetes opilio TaxID=41210 RepID=A0A8J4XZY1_CHIOP|nr:hypothetical protein GWK47_014664 [Chionoecetes opilio]
MRAKRATMCPLLLVGFVLWAGVVVCDRDGPAEAITLDSLSVWQCDFQEDLCGLAPVDALEGAWQRVQTNQTTTTQDSWSVALAPGMSAGDRAGLMWPDLPPSDSPRCLTFHYYLNGAQPGQLSVLLR